MRLSFIGTVVVAAAAMISVPGMAAFQKVDPSLLPVHDPALVDGDLALLKLAIQRQIATCKTQDLTVRATFGSRSVSRKTWCVDTGEKWLSLIASHSSMADLLKAGANSFEWYQSSGSDGQGLVTFTGYNSPTLRGSRIKAAPYLYPIYTQPKDLVQVTENGKLVWKRKLPDGSHVPYYKRVEIDQDAALANRGLEIAYVDDFFSATLIQIEGAGFVQLDPGTPQEKKIRINYAAQNGHPLSSPRKILQAQGVAAEYLTVPGMRRYFNLYPDQLVPTLLKNESYIFFRETSEAPLGVQGIELTPGHSLAVDLRVFQVGLMSLFDTQKPIPNADLSDATGFERFSRLAVTQDTGGAIVGLGRADIYFGEDRFAELASGTVNHPGRFFISLLP